MQKDKVFKILPKYLQVSKYSSVVPDTGNTRRWGILQIEINYTDKDISVLFIHFYICFPENIRKPFRFLSLGI